MTACILPYHGGKTRIAAKIASVLERSSCRHYCEPFAGGLAVLFALRPRKVETINDKTDSVVAFWQAMAQTPDDFLAMAQERGLHSETLHIRAKNIVKGYLEPDSRLELAWALWYASCESFGHAIGAGFGYIVAPSASGTSIDARIERVFNQVERIKRFQIFNRCGLELMEAMSNEEVLFYCDPPYVGTAPSRSYAQFGAADLQKLCDLLRAHPGDWALSGYEHPMLSELAQEYRVIEIETIGTLTPAKDTGGTRRILTEQLVTNIEERSQQLAL